MREGLVLHVFGHAREPQRIEVFSSFFLAFLLLFFPFPLLTLSFPGLICNSVSAKLLNSRERLVTLFAKLAPTLEHSGMMRKLVCFLFVLS